MDSSSAIVYGRSMAQPQPISVQVFLDALRRWLTAIDERDEPSARFYADEIEKVGRMLAIDPQYQRIFQTHRGDCKVQEPDEALICMHAYFHAATDAALKGIGSAAK